MSPDHGFHKSDSDGMSPLHPYSRDYSSTNQMSPGHRFHGSDLDGISPLYPYYSRDYGSTSQMRLKDRLYQTVLEVEKKNTIIAHNVHNEMRAEVDKVFTVKLVLYIKLARNSL